MSKKNRVLAIVATDCTFEQDQVRGQRAWVGKCIHCNARLVVGLDGECYGATIEHIIPRNHGGTDDLGNLALACPRCNAQKGRRLDVRRATDPKLQEVIGMLSVRRQERWRSSP